MPCPINAEQYKPDNRIFVIKTTVSDFKTYMHNHKTEFMPNYVRVHTEGKLLHLNVHLTMRFRLT